MYVSVHSVHDDGDELSARWCQRMPTVLAVVRIAFMVWVSEQCLPPVGAESQEERSSAEKRPSAHGFSACGALPHVAYFV